jgi:CPA2 family monovalent cation:H+ antiporter-2
VDIDRRTLIDAEGLTTINGDASHPTTIDEMKLEDCRVLVVTLPDPFATRLLVERARQTRPSIDIIARALTEGEAERLRDSGARETVVAEREIALEMVRHSLQRFGVDSRQALAIVQRMRQA